MPADFKSLFTNLIAAKSPSDVHSLLISLGDSSEIDIGQPLGPSGLLWHPVGDDTGNISAINLATKAGRSLTERITNALDAVLELRAMKAAGELPQNPRAAAEKWFGRPLSSTDSGLFQWDFAGQKHDRNVSVVLHESGLENAPTVDVLDAGIGITPDMMSKTILSLRAGNKISKFHLIGTFGQGGSSTLAYCQYAIYASRHVASPGTVAFTVVRVQRLGDAYKEDCYSYLALNENGAITVPSADVGDGAITLYGEIKGVPEWNHGTLVRHVAYQLPDLTGDLGPSPGNLYHYLHASLFDPLLPFRVLDLRKPGKEKNELVSGSRNRLMRYTKKADEEGESDRTTLRHYRPMEFVVPHAETIPSIGIEYWVPLNRRKGKGNGEAQLRTYSNELFVQRGWPIIGSLNGQNQGELSASFIRKLGLNLVSRHMIVHIDASAAPPHVRRQLFASTREGLKEGSVLIAIEKVLSKMLQEDEALARIERELGEMVVHKDNAKTEDEVKSQITRLLLDAGVSVSDEGKTVESGPGEPEKVPPKERPSYKIKDPLPTLPFPQVTKWEIKVPAEQMDIHLGDLEFVLVETDADAQFDKENRLALRVDPPILEVASKAPLSGGRIRWRLRTADAALEAQSGKIIASITRPDGSQLLAERPFRVLSKLEEPAKKSKGKVPPFEVLPIDPFNDEDQSTWNTLWPDLADERDLDKVSEVAYKTLPVEGKTYVYFNVTFPPFASIEKKYLEKSQASAQIFRLQYKVWIGYHALLQFNDSRDELAGADEPQLIEKTLMEETQRVATMQAKQAAQFTELRRQLLKSGAEEDGAGA